MSSAKTEASTRYRFGLFELDPVAEELLKAGVRVRIQGQPFRILYYLAQRGGEIVTREELHRTFWKSDTTVDLDRSLAAAVHKIRECLDDSVTNPRFIETVSRSGYRFIAPVSAIAMDRPSSREIVEGARAVPRQSAVLVNEVPLDTEERAIDVSSPDVVPVRADIRLLLAVLGVLAALAVCIGWLLSRGAPARGASAVEAITHNAETVWPDGVSQGYPGAVTDNSRVYFSRTNRGRSELAVVMLNGGETTAITLPEELGSPVVDEVSSDGLRLLLRDRLSTAAEQPLWITSPTGQTARQVPGVLAHDSAWMPDGNTILYSNGDALYTVHDNGSSNALLLRLPGRPYRMRFSPDGKLLRLTLRDDRTLDTALWELDASGSGAHRLLTGWHGGEPVCCGAFSSDGEFYVFQAGDEGSGSLWAVPAKTHWPWERSAPFRLAEGPLSYASPTTTRNGRGVVFTGFDRSFRLMIWDVAGHKLTPAPEFLSDAVRVEPSPDRQWIAWVRRDDRSLWRSRADGSGRVRVLGAPFHVQSMQWSSDGSRLAVMARRAGSPWRVLIADLRTGHTDELLRDDPHNQADPQWTVDGSGVIFGRLPRRLAEPELEPVLYTVDVATHKVSQLVGSEGLVDPQIAPDGRHIAAVGEDGSMLRVYDIATRTWDTATNGHIEAPLWIDGGHALLYRDFAEAGVSLHRLDLASHETARFAAGLDAELKAEDASFAGLLGADTVAISVARRGPDLYQLSLPE